MWLFRKLREQVEHERQLFNVGDYSPGPGYMGWPGQNTYDRVQVNAGTAGRLSAVWRCLTLLCDVISTLPVDVNRAGGRVPVDPTPALFTQPAADMSFDEWVWIFLWEALTSSAAWGLVVDRGGPGLRPTQIEPLARGRVTVSDVHRLDGREIDPADLFRFRLYPAAGSATGLDPVAYAAEAIGAGLAAQRFAGQFFSDSAIPSGILTTDQTLSAGNALATKDIWDTMKGGKRDTAVLTGGLKWQSIAVNPEESQNLETRKFSIQEACRYFGVPPEMIGSEAGGSLTYANGLLPRGQYVKFNTGGLLRTDLKSRYESYALALGGAQPWLTVDEVRALEDREPIAPAAIPAQPSLGVVA